ncbi:MAG: GNAT family N-acetyltransferase, partial [Chthoniobacteraceae bacterium]
GTAPQAAADPGIGPEALRLDGARGPAWVVKSVAEIPAPIRGAAFASRSKDLRYYELLESSLGEQFDHRYFILRDPASGAWAVQPFFFVQQDLLAGLPRRLRSLVEGIRRRFPGFLRMRVMMIGCAAGEGELDHGGGWLAPALLDAITAFRPHGKAALILLKDFPSGYRESLAAFSRAGFQRAPSMPGATLGLDFASFEDYMMTRLGRIFRKNLRRKFRALDDAPPIAMEVLTDASTHVEELHPLYLQTFHRSDFKFEELTKDYFRQIGRQMPDRARYFIWRQQGRIIAFSLCLVHEGTLYDLAVGLDYAVALDLHLYFVTWRDVIEWSLRNGIKTYHTGPLNYDPKAHLRMVLAPQDLYARANSALLNPFFKLAIKYLEPTRHDPVLKRFPNAADL